MVWYQASHLLLHSSRLACLYPELHTLLILIVSQLANIFVLDTIQHFAPARHKQRIRMGVSMSDFDDMLTQENTKQNQATYFLDPVSMRTLAQKSSTEMDNSLAIAPRPIPLTIFTLRPSF